MRIFAYGTLLFDDVMEAVVGHCFDGAPARLRGYERRRVQARSYPAIVTAEDKITEGIVFSGLDEETLARLDVFEGSSYIREWVTLETGAGAWTYVVAPGQEHLLSEQPWDPDDFLLEHGEVFLEDCKRFREAGVE